MNPPSEFPWLRAEDFQRHLMDLRTDTYEGARRRSEREDVFHRAVLLLGPVVTEVLAGFNEVMLEGTGTIEGPVHDSGTRLEARWELSWPQQRAAEHRIEPGRTVRPITIRAHFHHGWTHGHLAGCDTGDWPFQVTTEADARRQWPIVWAIAEAELHHRIFESNHPWEVVPLPHRRLPTRSQVGIGEACGAGGHRYESPPAGGRVSFAADVRVTPSGDGGTALPRLRPSGIHRAPFDSRLQRGDGDRGHRPKRLCSPASKTTR